MRLLLALFLVVAARAADWPQFLGPNHDATSPETGLADAWPAGGPPLVWQREVGTGYSAPSVRGGRLVLHHRRGDEEIVEAFDAATGAPQWRHAYPSFFIDPFGYNNGPRCAPILSEDRSITFGAEGVLTCLELATGKLVWRRDTAREWHVPQAFFGVGSTPLLADGKLFVMIGGQPDSGMAALDPATGQTLWENVGAKTWNGLKKTAWPGEPTIDWHPGHPDYDKQASYCAPVLATIHGRKHLLCVMRQGLVSLDPATGAAHFAFWFRARQNDSVNAMTPIVRGDLVLLSSAYFKNGAVLLRVAPDERSVTEVWRSLALEMHWAQPIFFENHLYAWSGRNEPDARFRCVEFPTGKIKWDRPEGWPNSGHSKLRDGEKPPDVFGRGSAIFADGKIFALGEAGLLGLFRPSPEKPLELARFQAPALGYPCWAGPVLSEKRLYLRSEDRVVCYDLAPRKSAD